MVAVGGVIANIVKADRYQHPLDGPFNDAFAKGACKHRGEKGEDIEMNAMKGLTLRFNHWIVKIGRFFVSLVAAQSSGASDEPDEYPSTTPGQTIQSLHPIVTHERGAARVITPAAVRSQPRFPRNAVRVVVAFALLVSVVGALWSYGSAGNAKLAAEMSIKAESRTEGSEALPALQPTFTPTFAATPLAIADVSELTQIVIVTPTPDTGQAVTTAGAAIERASISGANRDSRIGLMGLLPPGNVSLFQASQPRIDLSDLKIPPVAEEVSDAPPPQIQVVLLDGTVLTPEREQKAMQPTVAPEPPTPTPTPLIPPLVKGPPTRYWSSFQPAPPEENDHFWIESPFLNTEYNRVAAPSYQFGSTAGGQYRPHHGIDIANRWGTPVQAGVAGTVVFAGLDDPIAMGPYPNFYGNTVVIRLDRRLPVAGGELDVFVLYGHLSRVTVEVGQHVEPPDIVGEVGMTGIAIGPHLHLEVRVGENTYQHSVNPYLWVRPAPGEGVVAVRLITADGRSWPGVRLTLARFEEGRAVWGRVIETYLDNENIGPNPSWGENGALGDVPAGYYVLLGNVNGEAVRAEFFVREGQTTFVEIRTKQ
jgi:murein DD-endopeptidase MepM/ murein hydrolase activator NlpD